jgi:phage terminase large subunit-like protein
VFYHPDSTGNEVPNLILLDSLKEKYEFPELKKVAYEHYWQWEPDQMIVEKKASGAPLIFELRAMGSRSRNLPRLEGKIKLPE